MDIMMTGAVMETLGITRMTLYRWIEKGIIPVRNAQQGGRSFFIFNKEDVMRVKSRMKAQRQKGKPLLRESKKKAGK